MSIFGNSRAVKVIFQKRVPSENQFFLEEEVSLPYIYLVLGGQVTRLYYGGGSSDILKGVPQAIEKVAFLTHL